jgi:hypothetical protein
LGVIDIDVSVGFTKNPVQPAPNASKAAIPIIQPFRPELSIFLNLQQDSNPNSACKIVAERFRLKWHPVPTSDNIDLAIRTGTNENLAGKLKKLRD